MDNGFRVMLKYAVRSGLDFGILMIVQVPACAGLLDQLIQGIQQSTADPAAPTHGKGAPLPAGPNAVTWVSLQPKLKAWWQHQFIDLAPQSPARDPRAVDFVKRGARILYDDLDAGERDAIANEGESLVNGGVDDPAVEMIAAVSETQLARQGALLQKALAGFSKGGWPKFLAFTAAANIAKNAFDSNLPGAEVARDDQAALDLLKPALAEKPFAPADMWILRHRLLCNSFQYLLKYEGGRLCDILANSPGVDPWVSEYCAGEKSIADAWKSRGGGWSNTVTDSGWNGFGENLRLAREHLTKSWTLNPKDPGAADEMITVAMGENEETDTMRTWFDRSVAAELDYIPAYKDLLWGLRPRWLGSHKEMIDLGIECLNTGRYDTGVPNQFLVALGDVADDMTQENQDGGLVFADPDIAAKVETMVVNYLAKGGGRYRASYLHTVGAIAAYRSGNRDLAKKHLQAIGYALDPDPYLKRFGDNSAMPTSLR